MDTSTITPLSCPANIAASKNDDGNMDWGGVKVLFKMRGTPDAILLRQSFGRVVSANPILAARLCSTQPGGMEFSFAGHVGCPFHTTPLSLEQEAKLETFDSDALTTRMLDFVLLTEDLGIQLTGTGRAQLDDPTAPLCTVTYLPGASLSALVLVVSHVVADGASFFNLVKAWDQEFAEPGSSVPLQGRERVDEAVEAIQSSWDVEERAAWGAFLGGGQMAKCLPRNAEHYAVVTATISAAVLATIKARALAAMPAGSRCSSNDALFALTANAVRSKFAWYPSNIRGKCDMLRDNVLGNGEMFLFFKPAEPYMFTPLDVRRAVESVGRHSHLTDEDYSTGEIDEITNLNSWVKVAYFPKFGGATSHSIGFWSLSDIELFLKMHWSWIQSVEPDVFVFTYWGATPEQAEKLVGVFRELGASATEITTGGLFMKELAQRHHPS